MTNARLKFGDKIQVYDEEWLDAIFLDKDTQPTENILVLIYTVDLGADVFWTTNFIRGWNHADRIENIEQRVLWTQTRTPQ